MLGRRPGPPVGTCIGLDLSKSITDTIDRPTVVADPARGQTRSREICITPTELPLYLHHKEGIGTTPSSRKQEGHIPRNVLTEEEKERVWVMTITYILFCLQSVEEPCTSVGGIHGRPMKHYKKMMTTGF